MKKLSMKRLSLVVVVVMLLTVVCSLVACQEKYDLVYATWNLGTEAGNNIERQMVKAFEEKYDVKVKLEESISLSAYDDSIRALAVKDNMPDVFMTSNINFGLKEQYCVDVTALVEADESGDWDNIPKPIEEAVHFKSGIYAIPFAMHMMGYFVNVDLLEDYGLEGFLDEEITWDSFYNVIREMSNYKNEGVIGLSHESTIFEWYPASVNDDYGWFSWDGENYHLDSVEFAQGIAYAKDIRTNRYSYDSLNEEERAEHFEGVDSYVDLWDAGRLAIRWAETYSLPDMIEKTAGEFTIKFIGVPGGRTPIVGDYLMISPTCENQELAYEFAKWMSFGTEGMQKRIELEQTAGHSVTNTLPLTTNQSIIDKYFDIFSAVEGIEDMWANLDNGIVEGVKVVPGYNRARWLALTGLSVTITNADGTSTVLGNAKVGELLDQCWAGTQSYAEYASDINELANRQYSRAIAEYEAFYN